MKIAVVGSINMDIVNQVERHPRAGETIHGLGTTYSPGGKGANQAVAAAKCGADVTMIGAVGNDGFGSQLQQVLRSAGVHTDDLVVKQKTSGLAFITVSAVGENNIILSAGANGELMAEDVKRCADAVTAADILILQNEIPWETTMFGMELAAKNQVRVYYNPAPAAEIPHDAFAWIDTLVVNESEAQTITGVTVENEEQGKAACRRLLELGVKAVVLTLGGNGSLYMGQSGMEFKTPAFTVPVVDTTAAGDTFIGALASQSDTGVEAALRYATAAAALTVSKAGAQASIPTRADVLQFLQQHS